MEPGERFGDYIIIKRLSSGGMAEVFLARKTGFSGFTRPVAVKVILPHLSANEKFVQMFLNEARLAVNLQHANIAQTLDLGAVEGNYFIALEFAHGADLQQISNRTRKTGRLLPLPYAAKIISQIAEGLYYAHTKADATGRALGIIHRDVSPHNIIVTFDGIAKLIDFGVAKAAVTVREEEDGVLKGKFSYMSPEQIRGMPIDSRSDIFALGIVLWEISTGAHLYRESSELLTMEAILRKPVPSPRNLRGDMPPDLEAIILKALAKRSVDRFQNAHEMHVALEGYLARSGWNVGSPHLGEFMRKIFPTEFEDLSAVLDVELKKAEAEEKQNREAFVPWEPYHPSEVEEARKGDRKPKRAPPPRGTDPGHPGAGPVAGEAAAKAAPARRGIWLVLVLVLLAGAAGFLVWRTARPEASPSAAPTPQALGMLTVDSEPAEAQIFVNGKPYGKTPLVIRELPLGEDLTLRLERDGYEGYLQPVRLTAGRPAEAVRATLQKQ